MYHYRIAPSKKVFPGRQFTGKYSPRLAARAERIFAGKMSAGENFSGGRSYNGKTLYVAGDILIRDGHIKTVIMSPRADFSRGRHFNVTLAVVSV